MDVKVEGCNVFIDDQVFKFDYSIKDFVVIDEICSVLLKIPAKTLFNENVFALTDSKILWQIEKMDLMYDNSSYTAIFKKEHNLRVLNWDGTQLIIEPKTGKILDKKWFK